MFADNPVRFCNLRGQLEGAVAGGAVTDNDVDVRKDVLQTIFWALLGFGLALSLLGLLVFLRFLSLGLGGDDGLVSLLMMVAGLALICAATVALFRKNRIARRKEICERFELDPDEFSVIAASIMGNRGRQFRANGVTAVPHAVFARTKGHRSHHVALLLNRPFSGKVHDGDLFRLTLQMGIVKRALGARMVSGSIRYAGRLVKIAYSDSLYAALQRMAGEYQRSVKRWWPENRLSLRDRQRVAAGEAVRSTTVDWPDEYSF